MAGAIDWLKDVFAVSAKGPKPTGTTKPVAAGKPDRVRIQRPNRNSGAHRIETLMLSSYSDAMQIADILRENITVIVNVSQLSSTDRARLLDFMAGLKAGLLAQSSRAAEDVYLLAPEHVEVEAQEDHSDDDDGDDRLIIRP
jgi:FtsZ-interacting cell division protein YlmF